MRGCSDSVSCDESRCDKETTLLAVTDKLPVNVSFLDVGRTSFKLWSKPEILR